MSEFKSASAVTTSIAPTPGMSVSLLDISLWPHLLWARDRLRDRRRVLIVGEGASLMAVLLAREGIEAAGFDPDPAQIAAVRALADDAPEVALQTRLHPLKAYPSIAARNDLLGKFDAALLTGGWRASIEEAMAAIADALAPSAKIVVALRFGIGKKSGWLMCLPGQLARAPQFAVQAMSVLDGRIRAEMTWRDDDSQLPAQVTDDDLLRMTEFGSTELITQLQAKSSRLQAKNTAFNKTNRRLVAKNQEIYGSTSFNLGFALVSAMRSPRALLRLPMTLVQIVQQRRGRGSGAAPAPLARKDIRASGINEWQKEALRNRVRLAIDDDPAMIRQVVDDFMASAEPAVNAAGYMIAAQVCAQAKRHDLEFSLGTLALETHRSVGMLRGYLHVCLRARQMHVASDTLREIHALAAKKNRVAAEFVRTLRETSSYKIAVLELIPKRPEHWQIGNGKEIAYVLHNSLPFSSGGYATRSQGLARGLTDLGYRVTCITRPGFPLDIKRELSVQDVPLAYESDGVGYRRVLEPSRADRSEYEYVRAACRAMTECLKNLRPSFVQAGSNYVTGLPALVAARRLGIPFFYEVRGLWEITRLSRDEDFGRSISFDVQRHIESTLAREADHVFTLTEPMREELIDRGVDPSRITLIPNSVDAARFQARPRNQALAAQLGIPSQVAVIGYVGTFVVYEGLEDLVSACVELARTGRDFRLLLVGNENASGEDRGPITEEILRIAQEGGIIDRLIMPGRIPHEEVEDYYSLIDVCPFPRKPWPVCEMVSPMKPLEALAMNKAVVVSSVRALTEMIADGRTGMVFEKGSISSLAEVLATLLDSPELRTRLGDAGRDWVVSERSWRQVAERIQEVAGEYVLQSDSDAALPAMDNAGQP